MKYADDVELIEKCLAKNKKAWDAFVDQHSGIIHYAISITLRRYSLPPDSLFLEDIFQNVFLSLFDSDFKKLRQFQWKCKLSTWLHTISVRITIDFLRKQKEHLSLDGDSDREKLIKNSLTEKGNPGELLEKKEKRIIFEKVKNDLNSREQLFMKLYYSKELSATQISSLMKITKNNVYVIKNRIREKMKELVNNYL